MVDTLTAALGEDGYTAAIERVVVYRDELTLAREQLPAVAQVLRDDPGLRFELCLWASAACTTPTTPIGSCTRCIR